jgi:hypothetical protein
MKTIQDVIQDYAAHIGKTSEEVKGFRLVYAPTQPTDPLHYAFELVCGDEFVTYTRFGQFDPLKNQFLSITQKTRLWVPLNEVPDGAEFYTTDGQGPYIKEREQRGLVSAWAEQDNGCARTYTLFEAGATVECAFFYASGEGAVSGGKVVATERQLMEAGHDIPTLVGGCKFDFWAIAQELGTGRKSVFAN